MNSHLDDTSLFLSTTEELSKIDFSEALSTTKDESVSPRCSKSEYSNEHHQNLVDDTSIAGNVVVGSGMKDAENLQCNNITNQLDTIVPAQSFMHQHGLNSSSFTIEKSTTHSLGEFSQSKNKHNFMTSTPIKKGVNNASIDHSDETFTSKMKNLENGLCSLVEIKDQTMVNAVAELNYQFGVKPNESMTNPQVIEVIDIERPSNHQLASHSHLQMVSEQIKVDCTSEVLCELPNSTLAYIYDERNHKLMKVKYKELDKGNSIGTYVPFGNEKQDLLHDPSAKTLFSSAPQVADHSKIKTKRIDKKRIKQCYAIVRSAQLERKREEMFQLSTNLLKSTSTSSRNMRKSEKKCIVQQPLKAAKATRMSTSKGSQSAVLPKRFEAKCKAIQKKVLKSTDPEYKPYIRARHIQDLPKRESKWRRKEKAFQEDIIPSSIIDWYLEGKDNGRQMLITDFFLPLNMKREVKQRQITDYFGNVNATQHNEENSLMHPGHISKEQNTTIDLRQILSDFTDDQRNQFMAVKHSLYKSMSKMNFTRNRKGIMKNVIIDVPLSQNTFQQTFGRILVNASKVQNRFQASATPDKLADILGTRWNVLSKKDSSTHNRIIDMVQILHRPKKTCIYDKTNCFRCCEASNLSSMYCNHEEDEVIITFWLRMKCKVIKENAIVQKELQTSSSTDTSSYD